MVRLPQIRLSKDKKSVISLRAHAQASGLASSAAAQGILQGIASSYLYDKIKKIPVISTNFGRVRIVLQMITKFYEMPSYDIGNSEIQGILEDLQVPSSDGQFVLNDIFFKYDFEWDFNEEYFFDNPWMSDLQIVTKEGILESINREIDIAARLVQGFRLKIYSINTDVDLTDVLISGYKLLEHIDAYIKRNSILKIKHKVIAIAIITDEKTNSRLLSKLKKRIKNENLLSRIRLNTRSKQDTQLIIYVKDGLEIHAITNAMKSWWPL